MTALVPAEFLFRYTFDVQKVARLPRRGRRLLNLPDLCQLTSLADLTGRSPFGEVRLAWNDNGLGVSLQVRGKSQALDCDPERPGESDGLRLWVDTRNTQSIHRASRFCQQFQILPAGGGEQGTAAVVSRLPIPRASEEPPEFDADLIPVRSDVTSTGYDLEVWFPAAALYGFDPANQPQLGFFYALQDRERGLQTLSVGPEFPFVSDPSLWSTLRLIERDDA